LQMGLLALKENRLASAEQDFLHAWHSCHANLGPAESLAATQRQAGSLAHKMPVTVSRQLAFAVGYNLLLTRLSLGQMESAAVLIPQLLAHAAQPHDRILQLLQLLLNRAPAADGEVRADPALADLSAEEEQQLLKLIRGLAHLDTALSLIRALKASRPNKLAVNEMVLEVLLAKGKELLDKGDWKLTSRLLNPLTRQEVVASRSTRASFLNLLGCCACLEQDYETGMRYFSAALEHAAADARIVQNLALACEWRGDHAQAERHWLRFLDLLDRRLPAPRSCPDYVERLGCATLARLSAQAAEKQDLNAAVAYAERGHRLRPRETEILERLFHLFTQVNQRENAQKVLGRLREQRPNLLLYHLFELNMIELKNLDGLDRRLAALDSLLKKFPGETELTARISEEITVLLDALKKIFGQLSEQLDRVLSRIHRVKKSQVNWTTVHEVMDVLERDYGKLKQHTEKCLRLATAEEQRRNLLELIDLSDKKIAEARSLQ